MMNLKKGNQVKIISGKDRGKTGEILEIDRKKNLLKITSSVQAVQLPRKKVIKKILP